MQKKYTSDAAARAKPDAVECNQGGLRIAVHRISLRCSFPI
jgi:hypothetical protein